MRTPQLGDAYRIVQAPIMLMTLPQFVDAGRLKRAALMVSEILT